MFFVVLTTTLVEIPSFFFLIRTEMKEEEEEKKSIQRKWHPFDASVHFFRESPAGYTQKKNTLMLSKRSTRSLFTFFLYESGMFIVVQLIFFLCMCSCKN